MVTCWERADLLALVCDVYFPSVSWVRCGLTVSIPDLSPLSHLERDLKKNVKPNMTSECLSPVACWLFWTQ